MQGRSLDTPRKRQRRKDARPAEIIAAAMGLWSERGFAATRLEDVAAGAGVAKGTIYRYFPSKEALFEAAVGSRLVAMLDGAKAMADTSDLPTRALLSRLFASVQAELVGAGSVVFLRILLAEGHRFPGLVERYQSLALSRGMAAVRAILARGVARGELRPEALHVDARLVLAPVVLMALWGTVFSDHSVPGMEAVLAPHVDILLNGLAARDGL